MRAPVPELLARVSQQARVLLAQVLARVLLPEQVSAPGVFPELVPVRAPEESRAQVQVPVLEEPGPVVFPELVLALAPEEFRVQAQVPALVLEEPGPVVFPELVLVRAPEESRVQAQAPVLEEPELVVFPELVLALALEESRLQAQAPVLEEPELVVFPELVLALAPEESRLQAQAPVLEEPEPVVFPELVRALALAPEESLVQVSVRELVTVRRRWDLQLLRRPAGCPPDRGDRIVAMRSEARLHRSRHRCWRLSVRTCGPSARAFLPSAACRHRWHRVAAACPPSGPVHADHRARPHRRTVALSQPPHSHWPAFSRHSLAVRGRQRCCSRCCRRPS